MIDLVLTACLVANMKSCVVSHNPFDVSLMACNIGIARQVQIVQWEKYHPQYRVVKSRCETRESERVPT